MPDENPTFTEIRDAFRTAVESIEMDCAVTINMADGRTASFTAGAGGREITITIADIPPAE